MIQIARVLAIASVFDGFWTTFYNSREGGAYIIHARQNYLELKVQGRGGGGGGHKCRIIIINGSRLEN